MTCDERCLLLVCLVHPYLIVSRESIHKAKQLVSHSGIYQLVNARQWVAILGASLIQIGKVYTHSSLTICLLDHYYIGQPVWIINLSNELRYDQLLHFFFNSIVSLRSKHPFILSYKLRGRIHI